MPDTEIHFEAAKFYKITKHHFPDELSRFIKPWQKYHCLVKRGPNVTPVTFSMCTINILRKIP